MPSPTPILDLAPLPTRAKDWPTQLRWWHTLLILSGIFVVAPGIAVLFVLHPNNSVLTLLEAMDQGVSSRKVLESVNPHWLPVFLLSGLMICFFPLIVHEVVHALAGAAVGFSTQMLVMGPLRIVLRGAKPLFRLTRFQDVGFYRMHIPTIIGLHRRYLFTVGMAPLANLALGGVISTLWRLGAFGGLSAWVKALLLGFGFLSILDGLLSLVPAKTKGGLYTDGARMWMIARNTPERRRWLSLVALDIQQAKGTPWERLNQRWLRNACSVDDGSSENLTGHWMAYLSAEAKGDATDAAAQLEACLRNVGVATDELVDQLRAFASAFHAWHKRDPVKAKQWFDTIHDFASLPRILQIRTLVALRLVQNRKDEALAEWDEGLTVIKSYPPAQSGPMEKSWNEWKADILKRCALPDDTTQTNSSSPTR